MKGRRDPETVWVGHSRPTILIFSELSQTRVPHLSRLVRKVGTTDDWQCPCGSACPEPSRRDILVRRFRFSCATVEERPFMAAFNRQGRQSELELEKGSWLAALLSGLTV